MIPYEEGGICPIKRVLAEETELAARLYSEALVQLEDANERIERARSAANESRDRADVARIALQEHIESHGCWFIDKIRPVAEVIRFVPSERYPCFLGGVPCFLHFPSKRPFRGVDFQANRLYQVVNPFRISVDGIPIVDE
jgi:hypothetical protein